MLNKVRVDASQSLVVPFLRQDLRFEPMHRGCEGDARGSSLLGRQHPKRRIFSESLRVVRVLVPGQAAIDRLAEQVGQGELAVAPGAGIAEMALDERAEAETFIEFAQKQ